MAIVIKSIGSGASRDYATIQAFIDSIPTDVVSTGNSYVGELYNDSEFTDVTGKFNLTGKNTNSSFFITLRCAAGQSFNTNPNKANNPLWYNQATGVALKSTIANTVMANITVPYTVIDGLQIWASGTAGVAMVLNGANIVAKNCILLGMPSAVLSNSSVVVNNGATLSSSLVVNNIGNVAAGISVNNGTVVSCTVVKPVAFVSGGSSIGIYYNYNTNVVKNCAIFGFTNRSDLVNSFVASDYNATDYSMAPGGTTASHNLLNLVYDNQFVSNTNDFRLKAGSDLIDKGNNLSATYSSLDIVGTTRQTLWDIGAYEVPIPATTITLSGPTLGRVGVASSNFTVGANGSIDTAVTVTPSDGGNGGTFTPASAQLGGSSPVATFTYTPSQTGNIAISLTNSGSLTNPASLTYASVPLATKVTVVAPGLTCRAGVQSNNFTATLDGYVAAAVKVIPNDGSDGGSFNPPFLMLDSYAPSGTFTYVAASSGNKTISVTNDGSLANTQVVIMAKPPVVAVPTQSTSTLLVKSIGTGKDFPTIKAFTDFATSFDLTANQQSLLGEVYESMGVSSTSTFTAKNPTPDYKVILQPVPGTSVNFLDNGDPLDYGTEGIELTVTYGGGWQVSRGVVIQDFRLSITGTGTITVGSAANAGAPTLFQRCRVKSTSTASAIAIGQYTGPGQIYDCLLIQDDGSTGVSLSISSFASIKRSTFVCRGSTNTAAAVNIGNSQGTLTQNVIGDCVFVGTGAVPVSGGFETLPSANVYNNYTDVAMTTPRSGITVATPLVRNATNDFRPDDSSTMIGEASASAIDSLDIYSATRGGAPDPGAVQGSNVDLLPKVTITAQDVNAQVVMLSGTTQYSPTNGTVLLVPDTNNPNGAMQQGPVAVTLGTGIFNAEFDNVPPGNYQIPQITLFNTKGYNRSQSGGEVVNIIPISAAIVAAEAAPSQGNAPTVSFSSSGFDGVTFSVNGTVDPQGDPNCTIQAYIDFVDGRTSIGPVTANIFGKKWGAQFPGLTGAFKVRTVAVANSRPAVTTNSTKTYKVVTYRAAFNLPIPS